MLEREKSRTVEVPLDSVGDTKLIGTKIDGQLEKRDWTLDWTGLDWTGLDSGLDWTRLDFFLRG